MPRRARRCDRARRSTALARRLPVARALSGSVAGSGNARRNSRVSRGAGRRCRRWTELQRRTWERGSRRIDGPAIIASTTEWPRRRDRVIDLYHYHEGDAPIGVDDTKRGAESVPRLRDDDASADRCHDFRRRVAFDELRPDGVAPGPEQQEAEQQ